MIFNYDVTDLLNAISGVADDLSAEVTAREDSDTTLQDNITAEQTARESAEETINNSIAALEKQTIPVSASAVVTLTEDSTISAQIAAGCVITIKCSVIISAGAGSGWKTIGSIPLEYAPDANLTSLAFSYDSSSAVIYAGRISDTGDIRLLSAPSDTRLYFTITYQI